MADTAPISVAPGPISILCILQAVPPDEASREEFPITRFGYTIVPAPT